jgi:hypothetical protein
MAMRKVLNPILAFVIAGSGASAVAAQDASPLSSKTPSPRLLSWEGADKSVYHYSLPPQKANFMADADAGGDSAEIIVEAERAKDNLTTTQDNSSTGVNPFQQRVCGSVKFFKKGDFVFKGDACVLPPGVAIFGPKVVYVPDDGILPRVFGKNFVTSASVFAFRGKEYQGTYNTNVQGVWAEVGIGGLGVNLGRLRLEPGVAYGCLTMLYRAEAALRQYDTPNITKCRVVPMLNVAWQRKAKRHDTAPAMQVQP